MPQGIALPRVMLKQGRSLAESEDRMTRIAMIPRQGARLAGLLVMLSAPRGMAQFPPDSFTNLRVLPKTIATRELLATMRGFTFALGVSCTYCHAGDSTTPLAQIKFAADEKAMKERARFMWLMMTSINERLNTLPSRGTPPVQVSCMTCHRGLARPVLIADELNASLASGGAAEAARRYRSLREQYAEQGAYDFSESALSEFALGLGRDRRYRDALVLLQLGSELHPRSATPYFYLGEMHRALGDTAAAIKAYREALKLAPDLVPIQRALERLLARPPDR